MELGVEYHGLASAIIETCGLLTLFCCCQILSVSRPTQNCRGLWVELGVEYHGLASATIETCGLNLGEEQVEAGAVHLKDLLEEKQDALRFQATNPG